MKLLQLRSLIVILVLIAGFFIINAVTEYSEAETALQIECRMLSADCSAKQYSASVACQLNGNYSNTCRAAQNVAARVCSDAAEVCDDAADEAAGN